MNYFTPKPARTPVLAPTLIFVLLAALLVPAFAEPPTMPKDAIEMEVTGKYLLVPIGGKPVTLRAVVDDTIVHHLGINIAESKETVQWWTYLNFEGFKGKKVKLGAKMTDEAAKMLEFSDEIRSLRPLYNEKLRPQFHFSQKRGWNNDPNGMVYYNGKYHFFWQCNPGGNQSNNKYWGYATSPDMVHWTEQDRALRSGPGRQSGNRVPSMGARRCFSGSGHIDKKNTAGWKTGLDDVMVLAFTDTGLGESLAYSTDGGKNFKMYEGNPIIKHNGRDPKLIWYEPAQHWVIAVYNNQPKNNISFYTSKDLKEWKFESCIQSFYECPELFELPVDGDEKNKKWVLFGADAQYVVGHFDGKKFTPEHEGKHKVHWGPHYASQCFSNPPDGRVVQIGWARFSIEGMPFNQAFSLPTNLTLHNTPDGVRMFAYPIKELEKLRKPNPDGVKGKVLTPEANTVSFDAKGDLYDIVLTVKNKDARMVHLTAGEISKRYHFGTGRLQEMPLRNKDGEVTFRLLIDRPIHATVGGAGECFQTTKGGTAAEPLGKVTVTAEGGELEIISLEIFEMNSAWKSQ